MGTWDPDGKQVWLRAFYGFDPEGSGYLGFTHEAQRETMLRRMQDGDLVLIYGAVEALTLDALKAQALGFLEVTQDRCTDRDRMSDAAFAWKKEHGFERRWTYGIAVRRAWRVQNRVHIRTIAPKAFSSKNRFERTTRAILLEQDERDRALSHTVMEVSVFGEEPIADRSGAIFPMSEPLKPSQGIPPAFGSRTIEIEDGENSLYLMVLSGGAEALLGRSGGHVGKALVKVGRSSDPGRRMKEMNAGFPMTSLFKWELARTQKFPDAATAHQVEEEIKAAFAAAFKSQGGEFFTGEREALESRFINECIARIPKIQGAPGRAKGVR